MTDIEQKAREVAEWFARKYMTPKRSPTYCIEDMAKEVAAAIQSAVDDERKECAKIAIIPNGCACGRGSLYEGPAYCHLSIAAAIRARAQAKEKP